MITGGYTSLWMALAASGLLVPVPEDLPLVWAGIQVGDGAWPLVPTLLVSLFGVGVRDLGAWSIGRTLGTVLFQEGHRNRFVGRANVARARRFVDRHGAKAVLLGRFVVGFRAPIFVVTGAMGVPFRWFVLYDGIGLLIAVPLAMVLGAAFGHPLLDVLVATLAWCRTWVMPLAAVAAVLGLIWQWRRLSLRRQAVEKVG